MQRIISIGLSILSIIAVTLSAGTTYIAGYYLDEYEAYSQPLNHSLLIFLAEFVLVILTIVLLALLLSGFSKRIKLLLISQTILVTLILFLTLMLYHDFDKTRDKIRENNGNVNIFLSDHNGM